MLPVPNRIFPSLCRGCYEEQQVHGNVGNMMFCEMAEPRAVGTPNTLRKAHGNTRNKHTRMMAGAEPNGNAFSFFLICC